MRGPNYGPAAAIIGSALIGAAGSMYAANKQEDAQRKAQKAQAEAERAAREREEQMLAEQRAMEAQQTSGGEKLETVSFGSSDKNKANTGVNQFLVPKLGSSQLGTSGSSGLGFSV